MWQIRSIRSIAPCLTAIVLAVQVSLAADGKASAQQPAAPVMRTIQIGTPVKSSNVPDAWRQGMFLKPQSVSAVDISDDGRFVGVTTMAFRQDRNFWLLTDDGKVSRGRYVQPWAPFQAAVLSQGKCFGVGLAYSRVTDPSPTVSLFQSEKEDRTSRITGPVPFSGEKSEETALVDSIWPMGWLRYGQGDSLPQPAPARLRRFVL